MRKIDPGDKIGSNFQSCHIILLKCPVKKKKMFATYKVTGKCKVGSNTGEKSSQYKLPLWKLDLQETLNQVL